MDVMRYLLPESAETGYVQEEVVQSIKNLVNRQPRNTTSLSEKLVVLKKF